MIAMTKVTHKMAKFPRTNNSSIPYILRAKVPKDKKKRHSSRFMYKTSEEIIKKYPQNSAILKNEVVGNTGYYT